MARTSNVIDDLRRRVTTKIQDITAHWREQALTIAVKASPTAPKAATLIAKIKSLEDDIKALTLIRDQVVADLRALGWTRNNGWGYTPGTIHDWLPSELPDTVVCKVAFLEKHLTPAEFKTFRKQVEGLQTSMLAIDVGLTTKDPTLAKKIFTLIKILETT